MFHLVGLGEVETISEVSQRVLICQRVDIGPLTLLHGSGDDIWIDTIFGVIGQGLKGLFVWAFGSVLAQGYENMAVQAC